MLTTVLQCSVVYWSVLQFVALLACSCVRLRLFVSHAHTHTLSHTYIHTHMIKDRRPLVSPCHITSSSLIHSRSHARTHTRTYAHTHTRTWQQVADDRRALVSFENASWRVSQGNHGTRYPHVTAQFCGSAHEIAADRPRSCGSPVLHGLYRSFSFVFSLFLSLLLSFNMYIYVKIYVCIYAYTSIQIYRHIHQYWYIHIYMYVCM